MMDHLKVLHLALLVSNTEPWINGQYQDMASAKLEAMIACVDSLT